MSEGTVSELGKIRKKCWQECWQRCWQGVFHWEERGPGPLSGKVKGPDNRQFRNSWGSVMDLSATSHGTKNTVKQALGVPWSLLRGDFRERKLNPNFFSLKLFGQLRDIPAKSRDIPPKKFDSLGFEGHTELFGPHPFVWKTPTPPENIRAQKFRFGFVFRYRPKGVLPQSIFGAFLTHFWRIWERSLCPNKTRPILTHLWRIFDVFLTHFWRILAIADAFSKNTFWTIPSFSCLRFLEPNQFPERWVVGLYCLPTLPALLPAPLFCQHSFSASTLNSGLRPIRILSQAVPCLSFPCFFGTLFFPCVDFLLLFFERFPPLGILGVQQGWKIPSFLGWFLDGGNSALVIGF